MPLGREVKALSGPSQLHEFFLYIVSTHLMGFPFKGTVGTVLASILYTNDLSNTGHKSMGGALDQ